MDLSISTQTKPPGLAMGWFQRNWKWVVAVAVAAFILSHFSLHFGYADEDKRRVAELIEQFHYRMNTGQFDSIYEDAHPAFRSALTRQEWLEHMKQTREQYGDFTAIKSSQLNVLMGAPIQIRAAYVSSFEKGEATELFSFAKDGQKIELLIYGISHGHPKRAE
jgi:uncharacterized protein DUF4019